MIDIEFKPRASGKTKELIKIALDKSVNNMVYFITKHDYKIFKGMYGNANLKFIRSPEEIAYGIKRDCCLVYDETFPSLETIIRYHSSDEYSLYFRGTLQGEMHKDVKEYLLEYYPEIMI